LANVVQYCQELDLIALVVAPKGTDGDQPKMASQMRTPWRSVIGWTMSVLILILMCAAGRLSEGLISSARIVLLGLGMDLIYQVKVLKPFYLAEALMVTSPLVIIPYFLFRWLVECVSRWWLAHDRGPTEGRF
jgi:hypothetical protein